MGMIVGVGGSIHDFATFVFDGDNVVAIEDERITRKRYGINSDFPCKYSFEYCLKARNATLDGINKIIVNDDVVCFMDKNLEGKIETINHHVAHAYSAFFTSCFAESAILVVDGAGSKKNMYDKDCQIRETTTYAYGRENKIKIIKQIYGDLSGTNPVTSSQAIMSNSLGEFYRAVSETLGLGWLSGPGKMMGLASYGAHRNDNRFVEPMLENVRFNSNGDFEIITNGRNGLIDKLYVLRNKYLLNEDQFTVDSAIAHSGQIVLEMILMHMLNYLSYQIQVKNLCIIGGVALNSIANGKLKLNTKFENVHILFAPGDNGTAIGAAIIGKLQNEKNKIVKRYPITPYLGKSYSLNEILCVIKLKNLHYSQPRDLTEQATNFLSQGKVVAWFQGASEFGPRALGNRSILADPRNPKMREHINKNIKNREWYRPLAPVVIEEEAQEYFDILEHTPWMQFVWPVKENHRDKLYSITHVDSTARVQSVSKSENEKLYNLLIKFKEVSGYPILLNTSFNIQGEPIVETPQEAIDTFLKSSIDILVIGDFIIKKNK